MADGGAGSGARAQKAEVRSQSARTDHRVAVAEVNGEATGESPGSSLHTGKCRVGAIGPPR